jgi:hypothetical protein
MKLYAPLGALAASGKIGGTFTVQRRGRSLSVDARHAYHDPATAHQVPYRAMLAALTQSWRDLPAPAKLTWRDTKYLPYVSPYHAYLSYNLARWTRYDAPTQSSPPSATGTIPTLSVLTLTPSPGTVEARYTVLVPRDGWTVQIRRRKTTPPPAGKEWTIRIDTFHGVTTYAWTDINLDPGTYYYRRSVSTKTGRPWIPYDTTTVVVP